ncbi:MAG: DUF2029 domain-containing protein [Oligoflexia bacterium]|nr:DUF2029 domain-containing protein [Oligoflexia bacterium]
MKYKKLILIALLLASAVYCYKVVYKVAGNDFNVYYLAWELFITGNGECLYNDQGGLGKRPAGMLPEGLEAVKYTRAGPFLYPAAFAMLFSPLALLPHDIAEIIWYYLNILSLFMVFFVMSRRLGGMPWHYFLILFLITGRFIFRSLEYGQVNVLVLSGVFFCFYFYYSGRKNLSALMLAAVSAVKIAPVIMILYFIWKRDYKYAFRFAAMLSALLLAPALFYGFKTNSLLLLALKGQLSSFGFETDSTNQSIAAMFTRFFTDTAVRVHSGAPINVMLFELDRAVTGYLVLSVQIGILILAYISIRRRRAEDFAGKVLFEGGIMSLLMLLFSHLMWRATLVHLLLPHAALLYMVYKRKLYRPWSILFGVSIFLNTLTAQGFMGARLSDWFEACSCMTIGTMAIFFLLFRFTTSNGVGGLDKTGNLGL